MMIKQDLHIHTVYSRDDSSLIPEMTLDLIKELNHSEITGISDHFDHIENLEVYGRKVRAHGFWCGCEINLSEDVPAALDFPFDYYIFHCRDRDSEYRGAERLLESGRPTIISHPIMIGADLNRIPTGCFVEISNRYVYKADFLPYYAPHLDRFEFVLGSDAHQPHWLNQTVCRWAADRMGIEETLIFPGPPGSVACD